MQIKYFYRKNKKIEQYIHDIDVSRHLIDLLPQLPALEKNIRRKSLLKSSLYSARIEGNKLTIEDMHGSLRNGKSTDLDKREVFNIFTALQWIQSQSPKRLSKNLIQKFHKMTLNGVSSDAGYFRTEHSAIFNQAGMAIYVTPAPQKISELLTQLVTMVNSSRDPGPITASLVHFAFEKVHPFLDGNGRVGRLLAAFILKKTNYSMRGCISLEEFFEKHRETYYDLLSSSRRDVTPFVEFFLDGYLSGAKQLLDSMRKSDEENPEDSLLPRRREILDIIRDHEMVSFDFIRRRFIRISPSTIHYDLSRLSKSGFIKKLGSTNGALYTVSKKREDV